MKRNVILATLCLFSVATLSHAQSSGMKGMEMKGMDSKAMDVKADIHSATGVVTKVDKDKVTIKHEPVKSLNWPTMTMGFVAKDPKMQEKMKPGAKVDFSFTKSGKDYVITEVK